MTVRFCSRYPLGHRTHKNTHMKKVLCSPLPFACTLARKWGLVETKQNRGMLPAYHIERSVFQLSRTKDIERSGTLYKKARMEQNRSIDPSRLKQPRRFEGLVPFIAVFPYSELTLDTAKSVARENINSSSLEA